MKQMLVRNIDDEVAERFKKRAEAEGKSAEQALRDLIARYAKPSKEDALRLFDEIRRTTVGKKAVDPVKLIRRDRDTDHGRL
jgi:hypothetical protein